MNLLNFQEIWVIATEYLAQPGEQSDPVYLAATETRSKTSVRLGRDDLRSAAAAPFPTGQDCLCVFYSASDDLGCFLELGWPMPENILCLSAEFHWQASNRPSPFGDGLSGAAAHYGLLTAALASDRGVRALSTRGVTHASAARNPVTLRCGEDVAVISDLLAVMASGIDGPRALWRGQYLASVAKMERTGVPTDTDMLQRLRASWPEVEKCLVKEVDAGYGVYDGRHFRHDHWELWTRRTGIKWPRHPSGRLQLDRDTFKAMALLHPAVQPMADLRRLVGAVDLRGLRVGDDGRNRCPLRPFASATGRNQPSSTGFIFGLPSSLRNLIRPQPGRALAYLDYAQQEFGIAAALSGDEQMMAAYQSGDPYLEFARQARRVPADATRTTHGRERELFKVCALAVQYGMGAERLAQRLGLPAAEALSLLDLHRRTYATYWRWSEGAENFALATGKIHSILGWQRLTKSDDNPRSIRNFPLQANGADILRTACIYAHRAGITICAPVHDALLIEADDADIDAVAKQCREILMQTSIDVLQSLSLRCDCRIIRSTDLFSCEPSELWSTVQRLVDRFGSRVPAIAV